MIYTQDVSEVMEYELKSRSESHGARRIWHLSGVLAIFLIYRSVPIGVSQWSISLALLVFFSLDIIRLKRPTLNRVLVKIFSPIMRKSEVNHIAGTSYLLIGTALLIFLFPPKIVSLSLLFLAFADPAASFIGIRYGKHKINGGKSLEGCLAAFVVCFVTTGIFVRHFGLITHNLIAVALLGGVIGSVSEALPIWKLDDNLSLPLLSAIGLSALFLLFGGY